MARMTMDNNKWMRYRAFLGKICIAAFILALVSVFDVLISTHRKPANHLNVVAGHSIALTGNVYGKVTTIHDIGVTTSTPGLGFGFDEKIFKEFWLGLPMWRGELSAASTLAPGTYAMKIMFHDLSEIKPESYEKVADLTTYTIRVYGSNKALQKSELSLIKRYVGLPAWPLALCFFLVAVTAGAFVFLLSGKIDSQMAQNGLAEIYRVQKLSHGLEVSFGLGKIHGLTPGEKMLLFDETGDLVTEMTVDHIGQENSSAVVSIDHIMPGCMVSRINHF